MTRLNRLIASALVALCALVIPATAGHRQQDYEALVRWAGCHATLITSDDELTLNSFYESVEDTIYIGTKDLPGLSQDLAQMILFHEIGHCLQDQSGLLHTLPTLVTELDADRWAADLACGLGRDGTGLLRELFLWAHDNFGYDGDPRHGTLAQRIAQGENAAMCRLRPAEAPLVSR